MSSAKPKFRLVGALAALITLALAISCRGFFVNPTLTSMTISPSSPQVQLSSTVTLAAYGTYNDGSTGPVTKGLSWTSESPTVAQFTSSTSDVLQGLTLGTSVIQAEAQGVQASATATVYEAISSISISPTSTSFSSATGTVDFTVSAVDAVSGKTIDITSGATLTVEQQGVQVTTITCAYDSTVPAQVCTDDNAQAGQYQVVASYPPNTITATAQLTAP